jgi:hypothetical protein
MTIQRASSGITYPDIEYRERFARLVGLDEHKDRLTKILGLLTNSKGLEKWLSRHHPDAKQLLDTVIRRPPLVVLAGDVGSGKTELAETVGDAVAKVEDSRSPNARIPPVTMATRVILFS